MRQYATSQNLYVLILQIQLFPPSLHVSFSLQPVSLSVANVFVFSVHNTTHTSDSMIILTVQYACTHHACFTCVSIDACKVYPSLYLQLYLEKPKNNLMFQFYPYQQARRPLNFATHPSRTWKLRELRRYNIKIMQIWGQLVIRRSYLCPSPWVLSSPILSTEKTLSRGITGET
jgi:hypothetical protein